MKVLYYTVEEGKCTKVITLYDIKRNEPIPLETIECDVEANDLLELKHFIENDFQDDFYTTHLNKNDEFEFYKL